MHQAVAEARAAGATWTDIGRPPSVLAGRPLSIGSGQSVTPTSAARVRSARTFERVAGCLIFVVGAPFALTVILSRILPMTNTKLPDTLWQQFRASILGAGLLGAGMAGLSDSDWFGWTNETPFLDALREVGGALVVGAFLAGLVARFEDRREASQINREVDRERRMEGAAQGREDKAARLAWRKDVVIQLVGTVHTELARERETHLVNLAGQAFDRDIEDLIGAEPPEVDLTSGMANDRVVALLRFLRHDPLSAAHWHWLGAVGRHTNDVPPPEPEPAPPRPETALWNESIVVPDFSHVGLVRATRDAEAHGATAVAEMDAWRVFTDTLDDYVDSRYPVDDDEPVPLGDEQAEQDL